MLRFPASLRRATPGVALPRQGGQSLYRWALVATTFAVLASWAVLSSPALEPAEKADITYYLLVAGGILAALALLYRAVKSTGRRRRAWTLITSAISLAVLSNLWLGFAGQADLGDGALAIGDWALFVALCLGAAALFSFPARKRRGTEAARMILDGIVVGGSILYIVAVSVFPVLLSDGLDGSPRSIPLILIPAADTALATLAVLLILRAKRADRTAIGLLSSGALLYTIADLVFAVRFAQGSWQWGTLVDLLWIAGYCLFVLAALHPVNKTRRELDTRAESSSVAGTALLFALFIVAAVLTIRTGPGESNAATDAAQYMWIGVLLAVATRQLLYVIDNRALRRTLEQRVEARTAELAKLTERSRLLLTSVGEGIYGVDRNGEVTFANPAAAQLLGRDVADLKGLNAHASWHECQEDGTPYPFEDCYVTLAIRSGIRTNLAEDNYRRADGTLFPVEVTATPLSSAEGIQGAVVVFRDVTHRREIDKMKNEFVSVVSHELRTPLTAIRGSLGLLAGGALGELPARADRMVTIALESSERLSRLINDILELERIEAGTTPMDLADQPVAQVIQGAIDQMTVVAAQGKVRITAGNVSGAVRANADRVTQTLLNLIGNAIKFSPPESEITVSAEPTGNEVEFRVADQGRGIPEDKLKTIFKRFDQVDSSDAREKGGTGLGLAICKSIVERHGGRIWAESEPGNGSTFVFTLPMAATRHRRAQAPGQASVAVRGQDPAATAAFCQALEARGFRTIPMQTDQSVRSLAAGGAPSALVLQVGPNQADAAELIGELRGDAGLRGVAVVVVSRWHPADLPLLASQANGWIASVDSGERLAQTVTAAIVGHRSAGDVLVVGTQHDEFGDDLAQLLRRRRLNVCHPRTKQHALTEASQTEPQVLILDRFVPHLDAVELSAELQDGGLMTSATVVVYCSSGIDVGKGDDVRLGRTLFLDENRITAEGADARIAELLGAAVPR